VGLVLALVVFVFGLLPQGRGRLTYREFLRRTGALPLTTFNVASLLFNGMVLLGTGHQVPPVGTAQGHGWAVTLASIVALVSTGTIVVVLARALRAINPETEADVQREYQRVAVALASRDELLELESLQVMAAGTGPYTFSPAYPGPGLTISLAGPGQRVVRDVLVWRLHLLKQGASWRSRNPPVVRAWPGKPVTAGAPLMTVDPSSGWLERWWAQHCVRVRPARSDLLGNALTALHGETLEHVRAGRQAEAVGGMRALGSLQVLLWQAYAAHGRAYGPDAGRPLALRQGVGERIDVLLDDLLRAAAVSGDDAVRREATELPRVIARDALSRGVPGTVRQIMRQLEGVYIAVVGELSEGGLRELPLTGLARSRLDAPFRSLLSFVNYYLAQAIDQAAAGGTTGWDGRPLPSAEFLLAQLRASDEAMLHLLRRAVQFRDSATVRRVLNAWKMPDLPLARNAIQQAAGGGTAPVGGTGAAASVQGLAQSLRDTEADLDAMILRLLVTALDADRTAQREASPPGAQPSGEARTSHDDMPVDPDLAVNAILARLPDGRLWDILDRAIQIADGDWAWQFPDDEILPAGVVKTLPVDTISPLMEAFALAAIARPGLVARTHPSHWLALDRGSALITAVHQALADQMPWLLRYGCTRDTADREAADLRARLEQAEQDARREQEEEIRKSPVRAAVKEELRQAARSSFRESDIAGALFAWAGRLVPETGLQPAEVTLIAPRRGFTAIENGDGAMASHGRQIGRRLAAQALGQMMITVSRAGEKRDVHRADLAAAVRDAIAEVSGIPPTETGRHHLSTVRVAVFIPDSPYDLRNDLEITGAAQRGGLEAARGRVISELCIKEEGLASQVAGTVDGVPVITVGALEGQVLVIDLARFGELRRGTSGGAYSSEPELTLLQPDDPLRPPDGTAAAPARESQTDLLKVQVTLSLPADIAISDPSAARVLRIR
jgi:hypothetical protein